MAHGYRLSRTWSSIFLALLFIIGYLLSVAAAQGHSCSAGMFGCGNGTQATCVNVSYRCDGYIDCPYGEDESRCGNVTKRECPRRNQIKCRDRDGRCYDESYRCDGVSDCWTGIDEVNCTYANCSSNSFQCDVGLCVDMSKTCDGRWDCRDGSDEANCDPSMCDLRTQLFCPRNTIYDRCVNMTAFCDRSKTCAGQPYTVNRDCDGADSCQSQPCRHICDNLKVGFQCRCRPGFQVVNKTNCEDINECAVSPHVCSQRCTNSIGSYICSCADNYTAAANGQCVRSPAFQEPYLIFGNRYYIRRMKIDGSNYTKIPQLLSFVHVIDIDDKTGTIYYFDLRAKTLNKMRTDGTGATVLDRYYTNNVEGIAVDWVGRKLYWTSTNLRGIYVAEMNGSFAAPIVKDTSTHCRGIAVHPSNGYVFWSDWGTVPFIGRVGMDGSQEKKVITQDIFWPNGVTVDYTSDRLFWVDAQTVRLECSDLHGKNRVRLNVRMSHPYGITVFENYVFWTDWNFKSIHRADKFTGNNSITIIRDLPIQPFDIKVYSPVRQPTGITNPCGSNNGGCSHLCLIKPGGTTFSCACPQNMPLLGDGRTCNLSCSESQFTCNQGDFRCIPWYFRCNGVADCTNGEDELNCNATTRTCSATQFQCANLSTRYSNCHSLYDVCDGVRDCQDGSDEDTTKCQSRVCQMWEFKCSTSGRCIPSWAECNGRRECPHFEDESPVNPNCRSGTVCGSDQFKCDNGRCIDKTWFCDFDNDCGDMSDEPSTCWNYRKDNPCQAGYRLCPQNYRCIPQNRFCDGNNDCRDMSDEMPQHCNCKDGEFTCANHRCIPMRWRCDCDDDCNDGSDENRTMCEGNYRPCTQAEFRCDECKCLSTALKCNGNRDCRDGTDEENCTCPANTTFQCRHGAQCIDISLRCNGKRDCLGDSSDEENCNRPCASNEFRCNNSICISSAWVCDNHDNCGDGSDENKNNCPPCPSGQFQCPLVRHCISQSQVCDGVRHCEYGADELPPACNNTCVSSSAFHCKNNSTCVHQAAVCNGQDDCGDGSDEVDCTKGVCAQLSAHWCPQGCDSVTSSRKSNYTCTCNENHGFADRQGNGRYCDPENDQKGVVVHSAGRALYGYNLSNAAAFFVANTSNPVSVLDVDSMLGYVYWIDGSRMRRARLNGNDKLVAPPQDLCAVKNASGIASDWITRNVYWTEMTGGVYVTNVKFVCMKKTLNYNPISTFVPTSIVINPDRRRLYLINSYYTMPTIMTMSTSGRGLRVLIDSELEQPSDLTIDFNMGGRLFWVDKHKNVIESCNANGEDRTVMFTDTAQSPRKLDVFTGVIYWTPWSRDKLLRRENLGRGNTTAVLMGQTSIEALRFVHELRYGTGTINSCDMKDCSLCLLDVGGHRCTCPDNTLFVTGTQLCNFSSTDPNFARLYEPEICSVSDYVRLGRCPISTTTTTGSLTSRSTPARTVSTPARTVRMSTTAPHTIKPVPTSPSATTQKQLEKESGGGASTAAIVVIVIILIILIVALIFAAVWAYRRGHFRRVRKLFNFHTLEEDRTAFEDPDNENGQPSYGRAVSFDGTNVDFGNPLYSTMNADKIDTTPAYDDSDKKHMPGVAEVSSHSPYVIGNLDKSSSVA